MTEFDIHPDMATVIAVKRAIGLASDPATMRDAWQTYNNRTGRPRPAEIEVHDDEVPGPEGAPGQPGSAPVPVRIYRPPGAVSGGPCVVYIHGGAFVKGSLDTGDGVAWGVADQVGVVVVSVDYRLAPDHPYPAALEDCYAVVCHVAANGERFDVDGSRLGLWGDSAGGNLAAATCLLARDRRGPPIAAQALNYPCLTDDLTKGSYITCADTPGLTTATMEGGWSHYLGDRRPSRDPYAAPLVAGDLSNLPPAHVHYAEIDPLADDGRLYAARLAEAGNDVEVRCARRMIHGFLRARYDGPDAAAEFERPCGFLRRRLAERPAVR